jgi:hypothetical protein
VALEGHLWRVRRLLAFDTDLAPIVGQQVTLRSGAGTTVTQRWRAWGC